MNPPSDNMVCDYIERGENRAYVLAWVFDAVNNSHNRAENLEMVISALHNEGSIHPVPLRDLKILRRYLRMLRHRRGF